MFRQLAEGVYVSPQITPDQLAEAKRLGVSLVINNRPDDEAEAQPAGAVIEAAAHSAGMGYLAIPISHAGFSDAQVTAMASALAGAAGPVLAYCRSGTRSTLLWALAEARGGQNPQALSAAAARAGYDLGPIMALLEMLAAREP